MNNIFKAFLIGLLFITPVLAEDHHEHVAPHDGTLVVLGEEFAHLELVLDSSTGVLLAYSLDGEAENAVRLQQESIKIEVVSEELEKPIELTLKAVDNVLTGETVGDTSVFSVEHASLKGLLSFKGRIIRVSTKGEDFQDVEFRFPEGNEE